METDRQRDRQTDRQQVFSPSVISGAADKGGTIITTDVRWTHPEGPPRGSDWTVCRSGLVPPSSVSGTHSFSRHRATPGELSCHTFSRLQQQQQQQQQQQWWWWWGGESLTVH